MSLVHPLLAMTTLAALAACYDPANPLPDGVRNAVGDYDLAMAVTVDGDTILGDRSQLALWTTGVDCTTAGGLPFVEQFGLDGILILSSVDRSASMATTAYGTRCNDSTFVQQSTFGGTYVLQDRYLMLIPNPGIGAPSYVGSVDPANDEITFEFPGRGLVLISVIVYGGSSQEIAARTVVWRRALH